MTDEESKKHLECVIGNVSLEYVMKPTKVEALKNAVCALEKRIPKSGYSDEMKLCVCPSCKRMLEGHEYFCWNCGQAIDWSYDD